MPNICAFITCQRRQNEHPNLTMHRFPSAQPEIARQWIINSGNVSLLDLDPQQLRNKYLCNRHFLDESFINPSNKRRLKPYAVPVSFQDELNAPSTSKGGPYIIEKRKDGSEKHAEVTTLSQKERIQSPKYEHLKDVTNLPVQYKRKTCEDFDIADQEIHKSFLPSTPPSKKPKQLESPESIDAGQEKFISSIIDLPLVSQDKRKLIGGDSPRKKKLKRIIQIKKREIKNKSKQIFRLKEKLKKMKAASNIKNLIENHDFPSENSRTLVKMQLKTKKAKWSIEERNFSLMLFYKSPSAYNFLLSQKIILPAIPTLRKWIGRLAFRPGFSSKYLEQIKMKFGEKSSMERCVVLCFDEMMIMECLEYSKVMDIVEGFEDLGHKGRSHRTARYALTFMVRGLYYSWKLPIAYFLSHTGVPADTLAVLIKETIEHLLKANLIPKICVCDQGSNNRSALNILGVSDNEPYFYVEDKIIYSIYDMPHLIKNLRTNLQQGNFTYEGKIISFEDIRQVYELDKLNVNCRALPKLTDAHIYPDRIKKMSVKLAVQVLSHSVASAIRTCIATGEIVSATAHNTAEFVEFVDKLFDSLNSKVLFAKKPYQSALSDTNVLVMNVLNEAMKILPQLKKIDKRTDKLTRPYCFSGLQQTIQGIKMLFEQEKNELNITFLLTNRLNQDILENLFSIFRQRGGYNRNPTARTLRTLFRSHASNHLMRMPHGTNCEPDMDVTMDIPEASTHYIPQYKSSESEESTTSTSTSQESISIDEKLEDCSISYFAGYLAQKCIKEFHCDDCAKSLITDIDMHDKTQLFIINKLYDNIDSTSVGLKAPHASFRQIIDVSVRCFEKHFNTLYFKNKFANRIGKKIKKKIQKLNKNWFNYHQCNFHRNYIVNTLIYCKIFKNLKYLKRNKEYVEPKLRILKHK